jgi:hypothetical protein
MDISINKPISEDTLSTEHRAQPIAHIGTGNPEICACSKKN